jgi:hypothetical protein
VIHLSVSLRYCVRAPFDHVRPIGLWIRFRQPSPTDPRAAVMCVVSYYDIAYVPHAI